MKRILWGRVVTTIRGTVLKGHGTRKIGNEWFKGLGPCHGCIHISNTWLYAGQQYTST